MVLKFVEVTYFLEWFSLSQSISSNQFEFKNYYSACDFGTLDKNKVMGKIVYCLGSNGQDYSIKRSGGAGAIMTLEDDTDTAYSTVIPGTSIFPRDSKMIEQYINSTKYVTNLFWLIYLAT